MTTTNKEATYALALQEIDKFVKVFQAFNESKNAIVALNSLDQNTKELEVHLEGLKKDIETSKIQLEVARKMFIEERERGAIENRAKLEQERKKQEIRVTKLQEDFAYTSKMKEDEIKNIAIKVDQVRTELVATQDELKNKKIELATLEAKIVETRKQIANLLKD